VVVSEARKKRKQHKFSQTRFVKLNIICWISIQ